MSIRQQSSVRESYLLDAKQLDPSLKSLQIQEKHSWGVRCGLIVAFFVCLYLFMVGLKVMGESFQVFGGCKAGKLFEFIDNPIAGLMVGILTTVFIQSSSTTTSIVVSLVGSGGMGVVQAIPIIMGSNVGTTITSTAVACAQIKDRLQFERAFAAATVHDMFNILTVLVFLPIEVIFHPLYHLTNIVTGTAESNRKFHSPLDAIIKPVADSLVKLNHDIINEAAGNQSICDSVDSIIKGGILYKKVGDTTTGFIFLTISLILVIGSLLGIVKILNFVLKSTCEKTLKRILSLPGWLMLFLGALITFMVQSSSIVTSVLTPLAGVGVINLEQMYPLVLGSNIGTTGTALLASLVSAKKEAVQIATAHLFFNVFGILTWYPLPFLRRIPIHLARTLGWMASCCKWTPLGYIIIVFVFVPGLSLGISIAFSKGTAGIVLGSIAISVLLLGFGGFAIWSFFYGGKEKIVEWFESWVLPNKIAEDIENQISPSNSNETFESIATPNK